ncbi:MAG: dihydrofolate reductase [Bacteroidaceae bacterium]|nr:dihydrofolate reductase [Bacteroidaceae bacterium]
MLSIIVAIAKNFAIGRNNELLYHMPIDMKRFKETTTGHTVIMGKNTFASFPKRPLPNRRNIVLAMPFEVPEDKEGAEWVNSLWQAFDLCKDEEEVFIIGGAYVYRQTLPLADRLYLTVIDDEPEDADAFFPEINYDEWEEIFREKYPADERHQKPFVFLTLQRKAGSHRTEK